MSFLTKVVLLWLLFLTVITFILCAADKFAAKKQMRRVPEKTFFLLSALGGSIGMYAGMLTFRHKTQHKKFTILVPLFLIAWIAGLGWGMTRL